MLVVLPCCPGWADPPSVLPSACDAAVVPAVTNSLRGPTSTIPEARSARPKARRRSANARQCGSGCRCAPRPGRRRFGSGMTLKTAVPVSRPGGCVSVPTVACCTATTRSNSDAGARLRQPTQVRTGVAPRTTQRVYPAGGGALSVGRPRSARGSLFGDRLRGAARARHRRRRSSRAPDWRRGRSLGGTSGRPRD